LGGQFVPARDGQGHRLLQALGRIYI